jgi:hypothetical protein
MKLNIPKTGLLAILLLFFSVSESKAGVTCANPNAGYNVSSSISNNVPVNQCYTNSVGECLYNTANPASANGGPWNTGCPASVAGDDCCRWKKPTAVSSSGVCCLAKPNANPAYDCSQPLLNFGNPPHPQGHPQGQLGAHNRCIQVNGGGSCSWNFANKEKCCSPGIPGCGPDNSCPPPAVSIAAPFQQLANNPAYAELYSKCKQEAAQSGNAQSYRCCVTIPKDPCKERGLESVNPAAFNIQGGVLCCNSSKPREDMMSGKKVCCEVVKTGPAK